MQEKATTIWWQGKETDAQQVSKQRHTMFANRGKINITLKTGAKQELQGKSGSFAIVSKPGVKPSFPQLNLQYIENEIPNPFFQSLNELRVLNLSETNISFLPSSLSLLTNLQALYLDECKRIIDISILGKRNNLQILSMKNLDIIVRGGTTLQKALPQEIGYLTNLKMLDVTDACFETVPPKVISNLNGLEELYMKCDFRDWGCRAFPNNASFDEITGLSRLNSLKVQMSDVKCLPPLVGFSPNWVNFDICISTKEFMNQSYYGRFFERKLTVKLDAHRHLSRYLTLNTSMKFLPDWFIDVVTEKAEILEYIGYRGLEIILVEYHHGKLHGQKCLGVIECEVVGELMNLETTRVPNRPVFESLEELYLERVDGLKQLCVGELPAGSLCNLKLLNVRNCPRLGYALLPSDLLPCLRNLEIIHCESTKDARLNQLKYVFGFDFLRTEKELLPKLREITLPKLRETTLCYLVNLTSICCGYYPSGVFRNLNSLAIHGCRELMYIFEYHVAESLSQLELLWVEECSDLETVIESSWNTEGNNLVFPKLKEMYLNSLPQLTWICQGGSVQCPSLEHLYLCMCPRLLHLSASEFQSKNHVKANDEGHFAIIFERLFHRQLNPEEVPQFFSKKESDFSTGSSM